MSAVKRSSASPLIDLESVFRGPSALSQSVSQYRFREEQLVLASEIQRALAETDHCLAEAGTGVGKSLAYLVPGIDWAIKNKTRLVVSTHTKALQNQLMQKELPLLMENGIFERAFKYEICLGAENYVCLLRLLRAGNQEQLPGLDAGYVDDLRGTLAWCREPVSGLRQDCPHTVTDTFWQSVCIVNELCLGRQCPYFADCFLQQARQRQREADVLVANHYLFFSNIAAAGKLLPEFRAVVMDEAHKVEDVAGSFLGDTLGENEVMHLLAEIGRRGRGSMLEAQPSLSADRREKMRQMAAQITVLQSDWWQQASGLLAGASETLRIREQPEDLEKPKTAEMIELAEAFGEAGQAAQSDEEGKLLGFYESSLRNFSRVMEAWYAREEADAVYWLQRQRNFRGTFARIHMTPLDLSEKLHTLLFEPLDSVILTSATLAVGRDFSYFRSRLGIPEAREVVTASPFAYEEQAAVYLPPRMPDPRQHDAYAARIVEEVSELIEIFGGGLFVLCTSYRMLKSLNESLHPLRKDYTILVQGDKPPQQLLSEFVRDQNAVMLGVETFWQGVDVPGDALRCVAITRLPFDVPTHPVHEARAEYLQAEGENPFMTYSIPRAALMLRQGFGRLIRHHHDRGVVAILDSRIQSRAWGKMFLGALPRCAHLRTRDQVRTFAAKHFSQSRNDNT